MEHSIVIQGESVSKVNVRTIASGFRVKALCSANEKRVNVSKLCHVMATTVASKAEFVKQMCAATLV